MQRNTLLLVSALAVLAALVVGVNIGRRMNPPAPVKPAPAPTTASATPTPSLLTYTSSDCGFSLEYTSDFSLLTGASGSAVLNFANDKSKSIEMTCQQSIPRPALPPDKIEHLFIPVTTGASVSASLYHDQNASDGSPLDALIFTHPSTKLDVFVSGYGGPFNALVRTIQVIR